MLGTIKVLKGLQDEAIYPTTHSDAVYVDKEVTLTEKLRLLESYKSDLIIDLKRWGITEGLPSKPYTENDYQVAKRNITGFNSVLKYAHINGFKHVILPKGEYSICYPFEIMLQSNVTFNLGGSTFKVMYESGKRSPFDKRPDYEDTYAFGGISFAMSGVKHAHLMNGTIIGDVYERDFTNEGEAWYEHSYGVSINQGTSFSSVSHCEIRGYMGDNINVVSGGNIRIGFEYEWLAGYGDIANDGKTIIPSDTNVYTTMLTFPSGDYDRVFSLAGQGYSRLTSLSNKYFDVFFYDNTDKFIGVLRRRKVQPPIPIPDKATKYRLQFYDQNLDENPAIFLDYGSNCNHNVMEYNQILDGHRGGITMGGSYNIIQFNSFMRNGKYSQAFLDGAPEFPDPTRYQINQEDSYGDNCKIIGNHFSDSWHGVLIGCYSTHIHDNVFHNTDYGAIIIYAVDYGSIKGNYLDDCDIIYMTSSLIRAIDVEGNYVRGNLEMYYADEYTVIANNYVNGLVDVGSARFNNNLVEVPSNSEDELYLSGSRVRDSIIRSEVPGLRLSIQFNLEGPERMQGVEFKDLDIQFRFSEANKQLAFRNCIFTNCMIGTDSLNLAKKVELKDCMLTGTHLYPQMINGTLQMNVELESNEIYLTSPLILMGVNYTNALKIRMRNNRINLSGAPSFLITSEYEVVSAAITEITDNEFVFTGAAPLTTMKYFNADDRAAPGSMIANNAFTNMTIGAITNTTKIALYNRRNAHYQDVTLAGTSPNFTATVTHNLGTSFVSTLITLADGTIQNNLTVKVTSINAIQITGTSALALKVFIKKM